MADEQNRPPFNKPSPISKDMIVNEAGDEEKQTLIVRRDDFWATSNKQLNFLQHSSRFSNDMAVPRSSCQTMSFSKEVLGKKSGGSC
jgi:hypothetical protein